MTDIKNESPNGSPSLARPPVYKTGLSKPPTFLGKSESSSPSFTGASYSAGSGLPKPQSFSKPSALSKPPQFLSNKPTRRSFHGNKDESIIPRPPSFTSGSYTPTKGDSNTTTITKNSPNIRETSTSENSAKQTTSNASGTKRPASNEDKAEENLEENSRKIIKIE